MEAPSPGWLELRRVGRRHAGELSLLLQSLNLPHRLREAPGHVALDVPAPHYERAEFELERYERENQGWPPRQERFRPVPTSLLGPLLYALVLGGLHALAHASSLGPRLVQRGRVDGERVLDGEYWRSLTALTLHADLPHLVGNLFLGAALGHLCAQVVGGGAAWLGILAAGALGNLVNVWLHAGVHRSLGASTAVFGALGLLASLQWRAWGARRGGWFLRLAPFLAAGALLGFLGTGGERTDVGAHVTGLLAGIALGLAFRGRAQGAPGARVQRAAAILTLVLLGCAWTLALGAE